MKHWFAVLCLCIAGLLNAGSIITSSEHDMVNSLMTRNGFDSTSVNFLKDWGFDTRLKSPVTVDILNHPWAFPTFAERTEQRLAFPAVDSLYPLFVHYNGLPPLPAVTVAHTDWRKPAQLFDEVEQVFSEADKWRNKAFAALSPAQLDTLRALTALWPESEDSLTYKAWRIQRGIPEVSDVLKLTSLIEKIDFSALAVAGRIITDEMTWIAQNPPAWASTLYHSAERKTRWGRFVIGTRRNDIYTESCAFILDPAGNDTYSAPWFTDAKTPFYLLIDLAGDDTYRNPEMGGLFSVLCGVGANYDGAGDDVYTGGDFALSAFLGFQVTDDHSGDDIYRVGLYGIGAGTFGGSLLLDEAGRDEYYVLEYGEGFGGTLGVGALADYAGNDLYFAGGKYLHTPLAPNDYRSMAQGFGFGMRPDWGGGLGLIYEKGGNDTYKGGVYAQAVAYWYALGMILDESGNDVYDAVYYPQGSGIHLAGGFLFDREGEDHYYSKNGPGQGAAHDWAVGYLVDRAGNDIYSVPGGNGLALTNSVAVFLDVCGDDRYERCVNDNYGKANQSRDSGGLGFFLDLGGRDRYPVPDDTTRARDFWRDNHTWMADTYGFGIDTLMVVPPSTPMQQMIETAAADVDSTAAIEELFGIASSWGVGSYEKRVKKAQDFLLGRQAETAKYIYDTQLGSKEGLVWRAITDFAHRSDSLRKYIPMALNHPDSLWNKGAIALIAELSDSMYADTLRVLLNKKKYVGACLSALGDLKSDRGTEILATWIDCPAERYRVVVAGSLKQLNTPRAREVLAKMKKDPSFTVRTIATLALKR
jgi:hypothetical protein